MSEKIVHEVERWLCDAVIGLQLCPFAAKPINSQRHKIFVSSACNDQDALIDLLDEIRFLDKQSADTLETTLLVLVELFKDFYEFNHFLSAVDQLLTKQGWQGEYQIASFHPRYQFAGTDADDVENLTNAAPYPILHILREASIEAAIDTYDDIDEIPPRNIRRMHALSSRQIQRIFPYR